MQRPLAARGASQHEENKKHEGGGGERGNDFRFETVRSIGALEHWSSGLKPRGERGD